MSSKQTETMTPPSPPTPPTPWVDEDHSPVRFVAIYNDIHSRYPGIIVYGSGMTEKSAINSARQFWTGGDGEDEMCPFPEDEFLTLPIPYTKPAGIVRFGDSADDMAFFDESTGTLTER